ncbi:hypothetical protein GCK72_005485 [Caenorhabditis remanei]|uniref:Uncharacterized protein n=1 Tax=Caenorhabditis remanei TaxID=31234 RepID=A0A6A5HGP5_CAERE|nr:hypothetical protein GCK72_005485 [Caenorhabditis remanei]KAF1765533.1 hypothetical protein GCK72_005485 [Caenorhabditis remanei]
MQLLFLLFVPAVVIGFDSSFNYGCQNGKCTFQLVVPKEVAQFIDEKTLSAEVQTIASSITALNSTITSFSDSGSANFTSKFDDSYAPVFAQAQLLNGSVNVAAQNTSDLLASSNNANTTATLLYNSIDCFKQNNASSYTCFTPPVVPSTTQIAPSTTGNPSTDDVSTVSGGSTDAPISTVSFTGSTLPAGSTGAEGTSSAASPSPSDTSI